MRFIEVSEEDYDFISKFDPDRDRTATRADMVKVIEHIQAAIYESEIQQ